MQYLEMARKNKLNRKAYARLCRALFWHKFEGATVLPVRLLLLAQTKKLEQRVGVSGAPNDNFLENICSEDDLRSRIFGPFVVKFLACLPLLGFWNIQKMVKLPIFNGFLP